MPSNPPIPNPAKHNFIVEPSIVRRHRRLPNAPNLFLPAPPPVFILPGRQRFVQEPAFLRPSKSHPSLHIGALDDGTAHVLDVCADVPAGRGGISVLHKKKNQWRRWSQDILPALIAPYLAYHRQTERLRLPTDIHATSPDCPPCTSGCLRRSLTLTCILFDRKYPSCDLAYSSIHFLFCTAQG